MAGKKKDTAGYRPPIVTLLGHVDHGKTSILDKIRSTSVQEGEVGGITQSISVYTVNHNDKDITFIDTPGHESFDLMRSRGGEAADMVILVVAANDSVKPQTKESIEVIKKNNVNCIVAINKVDLPDVDIAKVKRDLANEGIQVESAGGDVPSVEVSAKEGKGIDELMDMIHLVTEVSEAEKSEVPEGALGKGVILESFKDTSIGNVSVFVSFSGKFEKGKYIAYRHNGEILTDKIKGFVEETGGGIHEINEGYGGRVIGLSNLLELGQQIYCVEDPKGDYSGLFAESKPAKVKKKTKVQPEPETADEECVSEEESQEDLLSMLLESKQTEDEDQEELNVVLKASSQGKLEAIENSLKSLEKEGLVVRILQSGVGSVNLSDVEYAQNMGAIVIGFEVCVDKSASEFASRKHVLIKTYDLIYDLVDELGDAAEAMMAPTEEEKALGKATIKQVFTLSDGTKVIGMRVNEGEIKHGSLCRVVRDKKVICEGKVTSMRCGKEKVNKMGKGADCGVVMTPECDTKEGDLFQAYTIVKL